MRKIYSFDVFDTCLCRLCGEPRLMFEVLSLKVQKLFVDGCTENLRQLFVIARTTANGRNLKEIYTNVAQHYPLPCSVEQMIRLEVETEKEMLSPIVATRQLVDNLRVKGDIVFISDMYLPSTFIREQLAEHGFFKDGDSLYVSDELGAWKHDGSLYQFIHEEKGFNYHQWHHYGDNRWSDYTIPRRLGIHAHYLHYDYLAYEEQWRQIPTLQFPHTTLLAGVARSIRLLHDAPIDQLSFVCDVSAPIMLSWVVSILEDCLHNGIKRVYFLARDTHSEYIMAQSLSTFDSKYSHFDIHYLFISTKSINDELCLNFFEQEGLASKEDDVAIVDSRGRGYFINNINALLSSNGYHKAKPYILQLCPSHCDDQTKKMCDNKSNILHNILYTQCTSNKANNLKDIGWLIENILSLNHHNKTIGYQLDGEKIAPVSTTEKPEIVAADIEKLKAQQDIILSDFAQSCQKCGLTTKTSNLFASAILPTLTNFAVAPRKEYLIYLTRISIYGKQNTYVHNIFRYLKTRGGHWQNGCIYYSFPRQIANGISKLYNKLAKRFK